MGVRTRRRAALPRLGLPIALLAAAIGLAGCESDADTSPSISGPPTSYIDNTIDPVSLEQVAGVITDQKLPLTDGHDATHQLCPSAGCSTAYAAEQLTMLSFPTTGRAELYSGAHADSAFQILDVVVTFSSTVNDADRTSYEDAIRLALR